MSKNISIFVPKIKLDTHMAKKTIVILFISLICVMLSYAKSLKVINPDKDLGDIDISVQDTIYWTYEFENISDKPVVFTREMVGCSCSRIVYPHDTIPAGSKCFVTVVLGIEKQHGSFEKNFCLFDQYDGFYSLTLSGNALSE